MRTVPWRPWVCVGELVRTETALQRKEPTHFITASAHQALAVPRTSALWIMEEKSNRPVFWAREHKMGLDCTRSLHMEARKRANGSRNSPPSEGASA